MRSDVAAWFSTNTASITDWDAEQLVAAKGDTTVSVVLPARDEAGTVGTIVQRLRRRFVRDLPLIDEIVVIDSGSCDRTGEVARDAGATVVRQCDVYAELGDRPGKGEAMWKSLFATSGDIVAFMDADLREFDPRFAVGLLGPLLTDPATQFVKAIYDRPLTNGQTVLPAGGGRVTELLARPLLNVHYPELAGVVQPLAGECAARRSLLERVPFVSGYGIEIAMLIDVFHEVGLAGITQVDLGCRVHRNSSDASLGRMATQVYLALLSRLERHGRAFTAVPSASELTQFLREGDSYLPEPTSVSTTERPPAASLGQYRDRLAAELSA